ncbi:MULTISPECIES: hypothetical protein [unclassified Nonomuraea]|uniref:hypothetical protein n=1 Tax=unclassified Nonomuraea TaxID=2593643 RepID=UPI0033CA8AE4
MDVVKPVVDRGITEWSTMAEDWEREVPQLVAAISEALAAAPWGCGLEGDQFRIAHFEGDGPNQMLIQCGDLKKGITDAGDRLRKNVDNTFCTNAATYQDIANGLARDI